MSIDDLQTALETLEDRSRTSGLELRLYSDGSGCVRGSFRPDIPSQDYLVISALHGECYEMEIEFKRVADFLSMVQESSEEWKLVETVGA
jgi:hypothetical protein